MSEPARPKLSSVEKHQGIAWSVENVEMAVFISLIGEFIIATVNTGEGNHVLYDNPCINDPAY